MTDYPRYAIYYAPEPGSVLDRFGAALLGYDAHRSTDLPFPKGMSLPDWSEVTQDPRKYGFHATLKAPMSLAPDAREEDLLTACAAFAETLRAVPVIKPVVNSISDFIAIVPAEPSAELEGLAADCVLQFDSFRAPITDEDRARRNPSRLTPRQRGYLDRWGYPYVFEEFRFHMTLTGRLDARRRAPILEMLQNRLGDSGVSDLAVDQIALFRQGEPDQRFRVVDRWLLRSASP